MTSADFSASRTSRRNSPYFDRGLSRPFAIHSLNVRSGMPETPQAAERKFPARIESRSFVFFSGESDQG